MAARELPESMWRRVESHRPVLTLAEATALINRLLAAEAPGARPIAVAWYFKHAAHRKQQRLAAAEPAVKRPLPDDPAETSFPAKAAGPPLEQAADFSRSDEQPCSPSDALVEGSESSVVEAVPSTSAAVCILAEIAQACNSQSAPGDPGHAAHPSKPNATATEIIGLKHAREEAASAVPAPASKAARPDASDSELSGAAATSESGAVRARGVCVPFPPCPLPSVASGPQ